MSPDPLSSDPNPSPDGDQAQGADAASVQVVAPEDSPAAPGSDSDPAPADSSASQEEDPDNDDLDSHRWECRSCGFVYDPGEGIRKQQISPGTPFLALDPASFRCPVCRSRMAAFRDIGPRSKPSGFEENLDFGLGVNRLTPGQKNVLIFGGFALAIAFFLSLYSLR
jgi:rubredoxin